MSHPPSVSWQQARENLYTAGLQLHRTPPVKILPLRSAIGYRLASDIYALMPVPHYDSSAMDGYAVAGEAPWVLVEPEYPDDGRVNIHRLTVSIEPGQATPILTGGLIPRGTEAVVREEHTVFRLGDGHNIIDLVEGQDPVHEGADIRRTGSELAAGQLLAERGKPVTPRMAAFLGMNGYDELPIMDMVSVRCAFTGNEVITLGVPEPGQVRDAFGGFMESSLQDQGCTVLPSVRLADTEHDFRSFLATSNAQVLIFTGGSSTSGVDMVRKTLAEANAEYLFESVQVRPGHPALAARLGDGRIVLGLPGNPLAAYTSLYSYLPPLLAGMRSLSAPSLDTAELGEGIPPLMRRSQQRLVPVMVRSCRAQPLPKRASYMLSALAQATHLAILDAREYDAGERVPVLPVF